MIFIAFCFFLVLFLIFLVILSKILGKIGNAFYGKKGKKIGGSIVWILLSCFIAYQFIEYYYVKNQVKNLCEKKAGLFIYVTPEQWKEENKNELEHIIKYDYQEGSKLAKKMKSITIDGITYKPRTVKNSRLVFYGSSEKNNPNKFTSTVYYILLDIKTNKVLMKSVYLSTGVRGIMLGGDKDSWKMWINNIHSCSDFSHKFFDQEDLFINF